MTFKAVMDRASSTTIPFGWDDAENSSIMKQVAVAFFNQVSPIIYSVFLNKKWPNEA